MINMQVKGKRNPVGVYEALSPLAAEQLPDRRQRLGRTAMDNFDYALQGPPVDLQTPLIGAEIMMSQVGGFRQAA